ncbi:hypothetical protein [Pseudomonas nunensis]|uniref:hypothetical protein n=1 Tax=Pseudomonas nunensis TaxID=2961896 RepID=UPI0006B46C5E|nr:hypothetical protein [Pseudomonas nunensis]KOY02855.1 hypothetical protein AM274_08545 [Pseudomonas nunensis]
MSIEFRTRISPGLVLLILSSTVCAEPCETILATLQQEGQLFQTTQTADKQTTQYRGGNNITLSVNCSFGKPNVFISWDGQKPDQQFYGLVGRVGSLVSSRSAADIVTVSKQCRERAIKDSGEIATIEKKGLAIECQAFSRDGGGTSISVFAE